MIDEARKLAEEVREYTAMKYAGDCKCGKCQLVPRALVERIYHTLNGTCTVAQAAPVAWRLTDGEGDYEYLTEEPSDQSRAWSRRYGREWEPLYASPMPSTDRVWPAGCHDPDSCAGHKACMYMKCRHDGRSIAGEVEAAIPSRTVTPHD